MLLLAQCHPEKPIPAYGAQPKWFDFQSPLLQPQFDQANQPDIVAHAFFFFLACEAASWSDNLPKAIPLIGK